VSRDLVAGNIVASEQHCHRNGCLDTAWLWLVDPRTGRKRKIPCHDRFCQWTAPAYLASRREVAFTTDRGLGIADQGFRHIRVVHSHIGALFAPRWSPDGSRLLANTGDVSPGRLYLVNVQSGRAKFWRDGSDATWSVTGQIVWQDGMGRMHLTNAADRPSRLLPGVVGSEPDFSPDGSELAYVCTTHLYLCTTRLVHPHPKRSCR
jgi:Tol biopolymer transport system component